MPVIEIVPYGTEALLVNFEQKIDLEINQQVHRLDARLRAAAITGVRFSIPAYCSLTVGYDPLRISFEELTSILQQWQACENSETQISSRRWRLPVCFSEEFAWDQVSVLAHTGISNWADFVNLFIAQPLRVFMLGFLPGFPYLGILPNVLSCPRKNSPRASVPAGSVSITGQQAGIYPSDSPGGWQLIGRTPVPIFTPEQEPPFLLQAGDELEFYPIDNEGYFTLHKTFQSGGKDVKEYLVSP